MAALRVLVWRKDHPGPEEDPDAGEFVYVGGYVSSAIAELVLQVVAAGFIGYTWGRFPNKPIKDYMQDTLRYMEILPAVTFICLLIVPIWHLRPTWRGPAQRWLYACMVLLCYVAVITAPWVYWTFFLGLPGSL
ncbi:hypothetical protein FPRO05_14205 [Fusarium proliferatum]|uniref:Uncharacterized protein n=1 Tax=Gibberella intermedia TaxID=948311 RepID=A0A365MTC9_GIBIN|nr:hypothetical protein FPRO05_14205 [Fusarium proliferatum]